MSRVLQTPFAEIGGLVPPIFSGAIGLAYLATQPDREVRRLAERARG
jgi:DNA-binding IclR family transcriptional regulator